MGDSNELCALIQQRVISIKQQLAGIVHRYDAQQCALLFTEHLPGDDVRVMFHRRDNDLVAGADELTTIAVHYEVDALGGAAHKDAFFCIARVQETLHLLARSLISRRGFLTEVVYAPMNVRVLLFDILAAAIDHDLRHLRRRAIVQIDERLTVDSLMQYGKVFADLFNVKFTDAVIFAE